MFWDDVIRNSVVTCSTPTVVIKFRAKHTIFDIDCVIVFRRNLEINGALQNVLFPPRCLGLPLQQTNSERCGLVVASWSLCKSVGPVD